MLLDRTVITLRTNTITVNSNSVKRSSFSVSDATDEHNNDLGLFTKLLFARLSVTINTAVLPSCPFPTCITPGTSGRTHPEGEPCITMCNLFFWPIAIFSSFGRGSFLVLSAPWHAGSPPGLRAQVWALAKVRGTCSGGSMWQVPSGRDSENVEPSSCMETQAQVKQMSDGMRM